MDLMPYLNLFKPGQHLKNWWTW